VERDARVLDRVAVEQECHGVGDAVGCGVPWADELGAEHRVAVGLHTYDGVPMEEFIAGLAPVVREYGRFNLLLWDGASMHCVGNHPQFHAAELTPGQHALSNAELDAPWPKQGHASVALSNWLQMQSDADDAPLPEIEPLFIALADQTPAADTELPDTGVGLNLERLLSPAFVAGETYGTRCSTLAFAGHDGIDVIERRFRANGVFEGERVARLPYDSSRQPLR